MSPLEAFLAVATVLYIVFILELVRRRQLREKYALLWLGVGVAMVAGLIFRPLIDKLTSLLGIYGPSAIFLLAIIFLMLVLAHLSWEVSRLEERTRRLAEEMAIIRAKSPNASVSVGT